MRMKISHAYREDLTIALPGFAHSVCHGCASREAGEFTLFHGMADTTAAHILTFRPQSGLHRGEIVRRKLRAGRMVRWILRAIVSADWNCAAESIDRHGKRGSDGP